MKALAKFGILMMLGVFILSGIVETKATNQPVLYNKVKIQSCCCPGEGTVGYGSICDVGEGGCWAANPCPSCSNMQ